MEDEASQGNLIDPAEDESIIKQPQALAPVEIQKDQPTAYVGDEESLAELRRQIKYGELYNGAWKELRNWIVKSELAPESTVDAAIEEVHKDPSCLRDLTKEEHEILFNETFNKGQDRIRHTVNLYTQLGALGLEEYKKYASSLLMLTGSRRMSLDKLRDRTKEWKNVVEGVVKIRVAESGSMDQLIAGKIRKVGESVIPYYNDSIRRSQLVANQELALFGEDAKEAVPLWRSAIYLAQPREQRANITALREPLLAALAEKEYTKARLYLEEVVATYPGILPDFMVEELDIDPDQFRKLIEEERNRPKSEEPKPATKGEIVAEERQAAIDLLTPLLGKTLFSPDRSVSFKIDWSKNEGPKTRRMVLTNVNDVSVVGRTGNTIGPLQALEFVSQFNLKPELEESAA